MASVYTRPAPFFARVFRNVSTSSLGMLSPAADIRVMGATPIRFFKVLFPMVNEEKSGDIISASPGLRVDVN
jgi:hypothetical protein